MNEGASPHFILDPAISRAQVKDIFKVILHCFVDLDCSQQGGALCSFDCDHSDSTDVEQRIHHSS